MALNSSGPISLAGTTAGQSIEIENGGNGTTQISLNDTAVRALAGVTTPNSTIIMPTNFYGKANRVSISYTFSSNTTNASLNLSSLGGYSAGKTDFTVTINSGVYVYSTSTSGYALDITGGTTGDTLTIVNNGYIMGQGGTAGDPGYAQASNGGPALNLGFGMSSCTINNSNASAYIGGGGGGGGMGSESSRSGGGAGGGNNAYNTNVIQYGASPGSAGATGQFISNGYYMGAPGGRIFPGTGGAGGNGSGGSRQPGYGGGAGGGGNGSYTAATDKGPAYYGIGGGGGAQNAGGANGSGSSGGGDAGGGGGGYGAAGGTPYRGNGGAVYAGGSGGKAVNLNGKTVTWTSGDTARVYGAVS